MRRPMPVGQPSGSDKLSFDQWTVPVPVMTSFCQSWKTLFHLRARRRDAVTLFWGPVTHQSMLNLTCLLNLSNPEIWHIRSLYSLLCLDAAAYCAKHAWPYLKARHGQTVVLSSLSGEVGLPLRSAYCASKFAVTGEPE
eukprot:GHVT01034130.1.p1 GENE.GHVT01034130.1~~GHVT01034130.1.p1  ORF type:complete len:139 (-),score=0.58 GHVT01034130.1:1128-1544(-)